MNNRPRRNGFARPPTNRRPPHPPRGASSRRFFARKSERPAFQRRTGPTFNSFLTLGISVGLAVILGVALLVFEIIFSSRVNPHVSVGGIALGGVSLSDAPAYAAAQEQDRAQTPITVLAAGKTYHATAAQFDAHYALSAALAQAMTIGHEGDFLTRIWNQLTTIVQGRNFPVQGSFNAAAVRRFLAGIDRHVTVQPLPAKVGVQHDRVLIVRQPVPGRRLDLANATAQFEQLLGTQATFTATLPLQMTGSPITTQVAQVTVDRADQLLSAPLYFSIGTHIKGYVLTPQQLVRLLTFKDMYDSKSQSWVVALGINKIKLKQTLAPIAAQVDRPPTGAFFTVAQDANGDYAVPNDGVPGLAIDTDSTAALILNAGASHTITVPMLHPRSTFTVAQAIALHLDTEMGKAALPWTALSQSDIVNMRAMAAKLDNTLLAPGQTLSLTTAISPVVPLRGYKQGLNVIAPTDVAGVDGGTDLVASLVFQAFYQAGLPILQRTQYPYLTVGHNAPGTDAVIAARPSGPDLRVANNTDHTLLLLIKADPGTKTTTAYVFNYSGVGRKVQVNAPTITLHQDGSVDVTLSRQISGDVPLSQDQITSHYQTLDPYP
jgi:vancomycin resistance protein YoaR